MLTLLVQKSRRCGRYIRAAQFQRWWLIAAATVMLQGCALFSSHEHEGQTGVAGATQGPQTFNVRVVSKNSEIAGDLEKNLDLQRYTHFPNLRELEFARLLEEARGNAESLLAAQGYFNPHLNLRVEEHPSGSEPPRTVVIEVEPGPQTLVEKHSVDFESPGNDPGGARQLQHVREDWSLRDGQPFTQEDWNAAKTSGLRELQSYRYPTAHIVRSEATVHADDNKADLYVLYDTGPVYHFGQLQLEGVHRYDAKGIANIARIPTGKVYSQEELLDAQQRLSSSGYFDSVFLMLDTEHSKPDDATVIAQLREAKYQKVVFGLGLSTDAGLRLSIDHTDNKMWPLGWRAVNHLKFDHKAQELESRWTAMPHNNGWAWFLGGRLAHEEVGDFKTNAFSFSGGRSKSEGAIDRSYGLKYNVAKVESAGELGSSSSGMINYTWTGRYFDSRTNPTAGFGFSADTAVGMTLTPEKKPFFRLHSRALYLLPVGSRNEAGRRDRLQLRGELGAIAAQHRLRLPSTLLFLTGGDMTVRGYSYQSIGTRTWNGKVYGGRYLGVASAEWQMPVTLAGNEKDFSQAFFVDTGFVSQELNHIELYTGVGTGLRWSSPVGPLETDVAYGIKKHRFRLHLRLGFTF